MSNRLQTSQRAWSKVRLVLVLSFVAAFGAHRSIKAHNFLREFIQHNVHLTVGAQHIDVTIDLTFFEDWSAREREAMDADGSGDITRAEQETYLKQLAPELCRQVKLRVAGRELALIPLYDPELDLQNDPGLGPSHHRLRLFFFAPTPELEAGDELVIEANLWPEAKSLGTPQAEVRDGGKLVSIVSVDSGFTSAQRPEEKRQFKFRCVQPPNRTNPAGWETNLPATLAADPSAPSAQLKPSSTPSLP
ncbi:MAG: hypothetical protein KIS67_17815 [Verrucomicrobiae bacterium]|nr:hypothetical protein [Verrucomicrobiae bacterium]